MMGCPFSAARNAWKNPLAGKPSPLTVTNRVLAGAMYGRITVKIMILRLEKVHFIGTERRLQV